MGQWGPKFSSALGGRHPFAEPEVFALSVTPLILVVTHDAPVTAFLVAFDVVAVTCRASALCQQGR
jgi:hypothetical protein